MFYISLKYYDPRKPQRSEVAELEIGKLHWHSLDNGTLSGNYVDTVCSYVPAVLEYDVGLEGSQVTSPEQPNRGRLVALANNTLSFSLGLLQSQIQPNTMDAFSLYLDPLVAANASVYMDAQPAPGEFCTELSVLFADPTEDIISSLNETLFRAGVVTAFEVIAVMFVLPLFWGRWTLGKVSLLSPSDVVLAFNAPLLRGANSTKGASGVVKQMGNVQVKFGIVADTSRFYDTDSDGTRVRGSAGYRLGIAEKQRVLTPQKDMRFDI
ncbi:hypothetical protein B0A55_12896 [Friedmanniomyces simplex]|uniref:Uncharacterized protein n=1 Tax=Friedmanniomyces simplex TaxID=329884 RepID=A0A4U0WB47_9PEZI|nr:hypothetical protein B0A55_12896 [Friedmanniomyces simplex]